ncbi:NAD+ synthase [Advenella sp. S44]|uniref:NAD+ synthase n=1 Tax=Advenella sp. S44 TaxID=1982755 RepID=UPI000C299D61|nr:NAD+ synthase [Advenella sp. S44]PJX23752.1 NAD+ synthase [Advenella sp. S44]
MEPAVSVAFAQINQKVGDLAGNAARILQAAALAHKQGHDILLLPELALTGYAPEDLLLRCQFLADQQAALQSLQQALSPLTNLHVVLGHVVNTDKGTYNAASVLLNGDKLGTYLKQELPNYSVFDEKRYFIAGRKPLVFTVRQHTFGVAICEDIWFAGAAAAAREAGAQTLLVLNASPYVVRKHDIRLGVVRRNVCDAGMAAIYCNLVGGQDELIFDGHSFAMDRRGAVVAQLNGFCESMGRVQVSSSGQLQAQAPLPLAEETSATLQSQDTEPAEAEIWRALVMGTRDYLRKNFFKKAVIGLSGGIDSAVVLAIAIDAIGAENLHAVMMPSRFTADISINDAQLMARQVGVHYDEIAIAPMFDSYLDALAPVFGDLPQDTTEENLQARIRGALLMALSNKFNAIVLTTGNKSELATGYCTLYGDMVGGYAPLKDIPKTLVYQLANWRNSQSAMIPERIITRPPSAELREDQTDQDSLPPYEVLDAILEHLMEHNDSVEAIVGTGLARDDVEKVARLLRINEYKRRQGSPGPKITTRAFGRDWRFPITNGYRF